MKLTIEQLSKLTKLSIPTLRVYVSRQKLGTKVGNKRVFSQSDVQQLLKVSKKSPAKKKTTVSTKKAATIKKPRKQRRSGATVARAKAIGAEPATPVIKTGKQSFFARLFGSRKQKQKVRLLDAKVTK
jgi:DNA-binding transcriptional MerR regulator